MLLFDGLSGKKLTQAKGKSTAHVIDVRKSAILAVATSSVFKANARESTMIKKINVDVYRTTKK
jgi:hypothetical protein